MMPPPVHLCVLLMLYCVASVCRCGNADGPLLLTPELDQCNKDETCINQLRAKSRVKSDNPGLANSFSGYLTGDKQMGNHLFFWFFPSTNPSAPVALWLNGGPGVSSMIGLFWENGPIDENLNPREKTWVGPFSMLYIDTPVGVGFSYSDSGNAGWTYSNHASLSDGYTSDLFNVLAQFYDIFPAFKSNDLYIGGQAYAAKYVTALAHKIHTSSSTYLPKLSGVYVDGPMYAPRQQFVAYQDFVLSKGWIDAATADANKKNINDLFDGYQKQGNTPSVNALWMAAFASKPPQDNLSLKTQVLPDDFVATGISAIKDGIHVGSREFVPYAWNLAMSYESDWVHDTVAEMGYLLDNVKVLISSGGDNGAVSTSMVEAALGGTQWSHKTAYQGVTSDWLLDGKVEGQFSKTSGLCRVVVKGAGLMAPRDNPGGMLHVMKAFINQGCL